MKETQSHHSRPSQADAIRAYLERGHSLTPGEALEQFGCARLGARIWELRRAGLAIASELIPVTTHQGNVAHVARYWLDR